MANKKYYILLGLFLLSLIASAIISFVPTSDVCNLEAGCYTVQNSQYNSLLGIKNSYFGAVIFIGLIFLTYSQIKNHSIVKRNWIHLLTILGSIVALSFLYFQQFVIHAYCKYCLIVDFSMLAALITLFILWEE